MGIYPIVFTEKAIKLEIDGYKKANENSEYPIVLKPIGYSTHFNFVYMVLSLEGLFDIYSYKCFERIILNTWLCIHDIKQVLTLQYIFN